MNHKGLVTFDRKTKKDSFYLYKAWWNERDPFVLICSKRFKDRAKAEIEVRVYSNQRSVTLYADGKEIGTQKGSPVFTFRVPLKGETKVRAVSGECEDSAVFNRVDAPNPDYVLKGKSSNSANWV